MELIRTMKELKHFSFLLQQTVVREIRVRYKQTVIGVLWAVLLPLIFSTIFYFLFGVLKGGNQNPEVFSRFFILMSLWLFFSNTLTFATNSIAGHPSLVTKVYFPRVVFPLSFVAVGLVDLAINMVISAFLFICLSDNLPSVMSVLSVIPILAIFILFTSALAILLAGVNVFYRDFRYLVPVAIQITFFLTPIFYTLESIGTGSFYKALLCNPLSTLFTAVTQSLVNEPIKWLHVGIVCVTVIVFSELSLKLFKKFNTKMADII